MLKDIVLRRIFVAEWEDCIMRSFMVCTPQEVLFG
jgi:hypothetical protein